jgi:DNA polymerase I
MFDFKRRVILDSEMNALHNPTKIWCIVAKDIDTNEIFKFRPNTPLSGHLDWGKDFLEFMKEVGLVIGHNMIGYDMPNINRIFGFEVITLDMVVDTLVLSRLFRPVSPFTRIKGDNRHGGHSLQAWGLRLGNQKIDFDDFSKFSEEQLTYCVQDVNLNHDIYKVLLTEAEGFSERSIKLEHEVAYLLWKQEQNGFKLDIDKAQELVNNTTKMLEDMDVELQILFPPIFKLVKNYTPKYTKEGIMGKVSERILNDYQNNDTCKVEALPDGSYNLYTQEVFNPQSNNQISQRLMAEGWKPKRFTDKGNVKTDKESLKEAFEDFLEEHPDLAPLKCLANYSIIADRKQKAVKWLELANLEQWGKDGRVHGRVNPIGAGTHRCSHYDDNMANIARVVTSKASRESLFGSNVDFTLLDKFQRFEDDKLFLDYSKEKDTVEYALTGIQGAFGWDSRDCWTVPQDGKHCLVGADAAGIQLRGLAHYMNDEFYIKTLLEGDIHEVNRIAAGISTRPKAKTFIYAWLLGAGDEKIGSVVGVEESEYDALFAFAKKRRKWQKSLLEYIITSLREKGRKADRKTVATIIKGFITKENFLEKTPALKRLRTEEIPAQTKKGYLIGLDGRKLWIPNEHLAMSLYLQGFEAVIMKEAMRIYSSNLTKQGVYFKQVAFVHDEFQVETLVEYADVVGKAIVDGIKEAGINLNSNCPLDGEYKVGQSWAQTH